jgi:hypothetical protein
MNWSTSLIAVAPAGCSVWYCFSRHLNKAVVKAQNSANSLVVLGGMLAAIAILMPLGAGFLPDKHYSWQAWSLVGALLAGGLCMLGVIYCMISLQAKDTFIPKDSPHVPDWINAAWLSLVLLALSSGIAKLFPVGMVEADGKTQNRIFIAHDRPQLGLSRAAVETSWGVPDLASDSELMYRTQEGAIIFCLDKGVAKSITETKETDENAVRKLCN